MSNDNYHNICNSITKSQIFSCEPGEYPVGGWYVKEEDPTQPCNGIPMFQALEDGECGQLWGSRDYAYAGIAVSISDRI